MALSDTLKRLSPSRNGIRIVAIIVAALFLPTTIYYLLHVRSQTGYFNDRNFRKLSRYSALRYGPRSLCLKSQSKALKARR
jgi:hypothetical protein